MATGPITSWQINGETMETVRDFIYLGSKITADGECSHEIKSRLLLGRKAMTKLDSILKSRDITLCWQRFPLVKAMFFSVVIYGCGSWTVKLSTRELILWTVVLDKTLEIPLNCKEIKPVNLKGNQPRIIIGRNDAEVKLQYLITWCEELAHWKRIWWWKRLRAGGEGATHDEMVGWHHWLNGHEFKQTHGDSEGQGSLVWCSPWGHRESDLATEQW